MSRSRGDGRRSAVRAEIRFTGTDDGDLRLLYRWDVAAGGSVLLEACLDLHSFCRHGEGGGSAGETRQSHAAADDLPRLEVIAGVRGRGQGDLRSDRSLRRRRCCCAVTSGADCDFVQRRNRAGIHLLAAVNTLGLPCALCADASRGNGDPAALHMGGFNLAFADRTLLEVLVIIRWVRCPAAESMGCELHITACAASVMLAVVQLYPIAVAMCMGAIVNDVVDRLGVGKDGLFNGIACAGITQRALRHFNADGRGGGRRRRTADGDEQGLCIVGSLLDLGGQTCWQIGKPAGNIRVCRKIFREYVATQRNAYVDRGDFIIHLAGYARVGNSGIGNARVGIILLIAVHPICITIGMLHTDTGECVESVHTITTAKSDALLLRFIFLPHAGTAESIHIQILIRPHDLCIDNISGQGDVQSIIEAGAGRRVGNRWREFNLSEVTGCDVAKFLHVAVTLRVIKASLDGGVLANRYLCTIV